ncbi:MAG: hypothetical protein WCD20_02245 [Rhodomicrobium sp.]
MTTFWKLMGVLIVIGLLQTAIFGKPLEPWVVDAVKVGKVVIVAKDPTPVCNSRNEIMAYTLFSRVRGLSDKVGELGCHHVAAGTKFVRSYEDNGWVELEHNDDDDGGWAIASVFKQFTPRS